ncbi:Gfo/Idh/MocA family protein [Aureliella helgolandensis]|uniref:Glucose--fructose oxidoreductase n=1 Tax=Aureliella helgolandensis TaxID=2527968 RepID=A0A518GCG5_9BACT|nr:Gfo/Idh/MocA family oxidoreductase [Aureliella helgolandensis]QDV26278.1 Glucose--fructose oxidoreductase precursor [Aureliella helgolandensis]
MQALTPEQKQVGQDNFNEAVGVTRRDFIKGVAASGAVSGAGLGAMYFGYGNVTDPVRVGVIGVGDEGNVLLGGCTPEYVQVMAIADIRPSSIHRAFNGDWSSDAALAARPGLVKQYGYSSEAEARKNVKVYTAENGGMEALLDNPDIEAIIIALPLFLHAPIAYQAMLRGKHVLTEKLMAHNVAQCKVMARAAKEMTASSGDPLHLATGHQRHYSVLYDNAVHMLKFGLLGQLHHIRAQWHRGNLPGRDSWQMPLPGGESVTIDGKKRTVNKIADQLASFRRQLDAATAPGDIAELSRKVAQWEQWDADKEIDAGKHGYEKMDLSNGSVRSAMEELCRWRLWERTGGGLMAELGSHQLDASTIFCSALREDGKKAHPLTVHAVGGRHIFPMDREAEDHVYCTYEFPGPAYDDKFDVGYYNPAENYPPKGKGVPSYDEDPNKKIVVTYSTINGNGFGGYGEVVMGTKGTLILDREKEIMLYKDSDTASKVGVKKEKGGYSLDTQASGSFAATSVAKAAVGEDVSRGYTEEIEHWAWCIRNPAPENKPRCYPEVAMADAVIALSTNVAMARGARGEGGYLKFEDSWFDRDSDETPDGSDIKQETESMKNWKMV